jgi:SAM-dependent methyltransferase
MIWIISGPTSAGKSTFIMSPRCPELTGLGPGTPIVWASASRDLDGIASADVLLHYNILRQSELKRLNRSRDRSSIEDVGDSNLSGFKFDRHAAWINVATSPHPKKAVVLVASKQTLSQRMDQVRPKERPEFRRGRTRNYSHQKWPSLVETVDLAALYRDWLQELRNNSISYLLVDSNTDAYPIIEEDALDDVVNGTIASRTNGELSPASAALDESLYGREEIVNRHQEHRLEDGCIERPFGLHTRGQDRSVTRDLVFPASLAGKSVLDVGSAHGDFSFEAEARGAERVVGVEVSEERFRHALQLKEMKGSKVEFIQRDIVLDPLDEQFDYVLLLNVLHHVHDPIRALRQLASITTERLVIEFPTLADRKFQGTLETVLPQDYEKHPLVGVSSMRNRVGQTFMFSPSAIQRILMDHAPLFDDVEILDSPTPGRAIALFHKRSPEMVTASDGLSRATQRQEVSREERRRRRREDRRSGDRT